MDNQAGLAPVIVGYGRAGRDLHHRALRELGLGPVTVIDPRPPAAPPPDVTWRPDVACLTGLDRAVVHVTTPPATHLDVVLELLALGASRLIVEKPLADTAARARAMIAAAERAGASVLPVSVWPASSVTAQLVSRLPELGPMRALTVKHHKPRLHRTLAGDAHRTAFQIEMPHQLVLALYLAGPVEEVLDAELIPLLLPDVRLDWLGGACMRLRHTSGVTSELVSHLLLSERRRTVTVSGERGWLEGRYPLHADDFAGELLSSADPGRGPIPDRPLTSFLSAAYAYLAGHTANRPAGASLRLHLQACELIEVATRQALARRHRRPQHEHAEAVR